MYQVSALPSSNIRCFRSLVTNGNSGNLLKVGSKRRRSKQQIKEEKLAALQKEQEIQAKLAQFDQMQAALQQSERERLDMSSKTEEVQKMLDNGLLKINPDGNISIVEDPAEAEYIRSEISKPPTRRLSGLIGMAVAL